MAKTDDDKYVAVAHDLKDKSLKRLEIFNAPSERTYNWFMEQKLFSISTRGLKPLSLERILTILETYSDIVIMLDLFGMFSSDESSDFTRTISDFIIDDSLIDRLLLEAYNLNMVAGIKQINEKINVIYCARYEDNNNDKNAVSCEELKKWNIKFVSYPWYCSKDHPKEIKGYARNGIVVFSRTKYNTIDSILKNAGVSVNIIAKRFDGWRIMYQWPLYMATYIKRVFIKLYITMRKN